VKYRELEVAVSSKTFNELLNVMRADLPISVDWSIQEPPFALIFYDGSVIKDTDLYIIRRKT
jgi:hypothetical protein